MKRIFALTLALMMVVSLAACGEPAAESSTSAAGVAFTVVVTDLEGNSATYTYTSDADSVGEALLAEGMLAGEQGDYGLFIHAVNGIEANWDQDQTYWAFYIDGEYALTGVELTPITEGATYSFVLTKG